MYLKNCPNQRFTCSLLSIIVGRERRSNCLLFVIWKKYIWVIHEKWMRYLNSFIQKDSRMNSYEHLMSIWWAEKVKNQLNITLRCNGGWRVTRGFLICGESGYLWICVGGRVCRNRILEVQSNPNRRMLIFCNHQSSQIESR